MHAQGRLQRSLPDRPDARPHKTARAERDVDLTETIRIAAHDGTPGVSSDEGDGDAWPAIRSKILAADILVFGGPVWMGELGNAAHLAGVLEATPFPA